jgi:endonuclease/exonuclease/phosphatase family metal-dependent hydrolase
MALTDFKYKIVTVDGNGKVLVNESTNYVTIAYNTETVELIEFEQGKLPTGSNKSVRNVTSAIFNLKATNERCIVMSVHFNTSESQIENNGHEILDFISDLKTRYPDYPIVLAGDFNTREGSVAYDTIVNGSGFTDTKTADKLGLVMDTYHKGNGFDSTTTLGRDSIYPKHVMTTTSIDHIFTDNNIQVLYFNTVCDDDALLASDHLPTYCDISFKNEQPKSYTYTVEDGLFASVTDGGAYAEGLYRSRIGAALERAGRRL